MRVLMISLDKGLVGGRPLGDVILRHKRYGEFVEALDIIVLCKKGYEFKKISDNARATPTNSWSRLFYYQDALRIAREWFKNMKYDLIVTQDPFITGWVGVKLKKEFKAKLLVHLHGDFSLNFVTKYAVRNADAIRVMSKGQKEKLIKAGISENKIQVIATPVEIEKFLSNAKKPPLKVREGKLCTILYVGRLTVKKNVSLLIEAGKILKAFPPRRTKFLIQIIGQGPEEEKLKLLSSGEDNIVFLGQKPQEELASFYQAADVVVLPSNTESFGKVLVEANACGKPVIATATTGAKEIVKDGYNGFLVPVGDAKAFAEKILYMLDHPKIAREIGENGQKLVEERFSDNTSKIIEFWKEIVSG